MAMRAGFRNVQRVYRSERIADRADVVDAVTIDAGGGRRVSGLHSVTMHAREVLGVLVHAFARVELAHELGVAVTAGA